MSIKTLLPKILLLFICGVSIWSCEPSEEGCLDLLSTNYGFQAVNECDSCCIYPNLNLAFTLTNDSMTFSLSDTIILNGGDSLLLNNIDVLLSQIELTSAHMSYRILDSLVINGINLKDDYAYINLPSSSYNVGDIRFQDSIQMVKMLLGFNENEVELYKPFELIDSESNLDLALDSLYSLENNEYYYSKLLFELNDSLFQINLNNKGQDLVFLLAEYVSAGTDLTIGIQLDVNKLFEGVEPEMSAEEMTAQIDQNFINAIYIP